MKTIRNHCTSEVPCYIRVGEQYLSDDLTLVDNFDDACGFANPSAAFIITNNLEYPEADIHPMPDEPTLAERIKDAYLMAESIIALSVKKIPGIKVTEENLRDLALMRDMAYKHAEFMEAPKSGPAPEEESHSYFGGFWGDGHGRPSPGKRSPDYEEENEEAESRKAKLVNAEGIVREKVDLDEILEEGYALKIDQYVLSKEEGTYYRADVTKPSSPTVKHTELLYFVEDSEADEDEDRRFFFKASDALSYILN